ncbi:unnamed protein product [Heterobilharzia americana]|nr:unnamed protein product [Heterobilharzia americana]
MRFLQIVMIVVCLSTSVVLSFRPGRVFSLIKQPGIHDTDDLELDDPLLFQRFFYRQQVSKDSGDGGQNFMVI